jgi:methyl-accepting chemotaxis protein
VAGEVRKLADRTSQYTREIAGTIGVIKDQAGNSLQNMEVALQSVTESIGKAEETDRSLREITSKAATIAHEVASSMAEVSSQATEARLLAERITASGEAVAKSTLEVYSRLCAFRLDDTDRAVEHLLLGAASEFETKLRRDVGAGRTSAAALFDEAYVSAGGEQHANRSSGYFGAEILPLLKRWKGQHRSVIYVVAMDRNGFMPVHLLAARTGVIMRDPVSQTGARSKRILGQAFRRPLEAGGELVVDVSYPVALGGRHWGCLRVGYLPEAGQA